MDLQLKEKVFIVTGGGTGIGEAISMGLHEEGAIPVIVGNNPEGAEKVKEKISQNNGKCLVINEELGNEETCKNIINQVVSELEQIDGIVNNAGTNDGAGLLSGTPESFRKSLSKNLNHYFDLVHYATPELIKTKGSIINISSKTALTGQGGTSGYVASKGAQLALTREWALELAPLGIRVNAVIPAEVVTPMYDQWLSTQENPKEKLEEIESKIPLKNRRTTPEEIANTVLFLLSEKSAHTTGQWLFVDGGYVHLDRAAT